MSTRAETIRILERPFGAVRSDIRAALPQLGVLRTPLFHKILLANVAAVFLATAACALVVLKLGGLSGAMSPLGVAVAIGAVAAVAVVPVYAVLLRLALKPIQILERTAERGELTARATPSKFADPRIEQLTRVFNRMLDSTAADRERLREVAARAFQAQEAERMRIARELNEETAQTLATLLLGVGAVRRAADAKTQDELMEELRQEITDLTERVRGFARGLYPPTLKQLGAAAAISTHARSVEESSGISIEIGGDDIRGVLSPEGEIALYRIVQDALANVVRHAGAKQARIGICRHDSGVEATVEDKGVGFDLATAAKSPCLGLLGMQERALYVSGTVTVQSKPGVGTRLRVRIPDVKQ